MAAASQEHALSPRPSKPVLAVVGGGMTGLAAAWEALGHPDGPGVVLLDAGTRLGGRIVTEEFMGLPVDAGADAFIARVPDGVELSRALGLGERLVAPATGRAFVWARGRLRPLPPGLVLGVPSRLLPVVRSGILSPAMAARALLEPLLPRTIRPDSGDCAVSDLVAQRYGRGVDAWLVDPLLGGIHAGTTARLSLDATAPQLAAVARRSRSLSLGLRSVPASTPAAPADPVFLAPRGGMQELVEALREALRAGGADIRTGAEALSLRRGAHRWSIETPGATVEAEAVVLAAPSAVSAQLLRPVAPAAADELSAIEHASVAMVTFAYPDAALERTLDGSGFLVPRATGRLMTACSWTSSKWPHLKPTGHVLMRVSAGRLGDGRAFELDDDELSRRLHDELTQIGGVTGPPAATRVTRWPSAFPQYEVGHLGRVARIEKAVAAHPGLAVAGSALGGVGIPACIAQGRSAARRAVAGAPARVRR